MDQIPYLLIIFWFLFSLFAVFSKSKKLLGITINEKVIESIPHVFTTLGVFGTFLGIVIGLLEFDVYDINDSIPQFLVGIKTAFYTSLGGILLSIIFGRIIDFRHKTVFSESITQEQNILEMLFSINDNNVEKSEIIIQTIEKMEHSIEQLAYHTFPNLFNEMNHNVLKIANNVEQTNSSLYETKKELSENSDALINILARNNSLTNDKLSEINNNITETNRVLVEKFDSQNEKQNLQHVELLSSIKHLADEISKNNTEVLVEVMKKATEDFNTQMKEIIDRLIKENFEQLNHSVENMITWQKDNKENIEILTSKFDEVTNNLAITSESINSITQNTNRLVDNNGVLANLVETLRDVMIDDENFKEIGRNLTNSSVLIESSTTAFENTTHKLNEWVKNQMGLTDSVTVLISKLEKIDNIEDINERFWKDIKKNMNEGISIIKNANEKLASDLDNINENFYSELNTTLQYLDKLIQTHIEQVRRGAA